MNFSYVVAEHARRTPSRVAIVVDGSRITYARLDDRVSRLTVGLAALGIGRGSRVALMLGNGPAFLESYLAVIRAGACCVPLNWRLAADEIAYALEHSAAQLVITEDRYAETLSIAAGVAGTHVVTTGRSYAPGWEAYDALFDHAGSAAIAPTEMTDVQRVMYTSGTTDRPKGAMITHGQVWWGCASRAVDFQLTARDVGLVVAPLYHVGGLDSYCTAMLYLGGTIVVLDRFDPEAVVGAIERERVTNCWLAPTMLNMIFDTVGHGRYDVSSLRVLLTGGEKAPAPLLKRLADQWPSAGLYDAYGLTECQGIATWLHPSEQSVRRGSVGKPGWMREVRLDDDGVEPSTGEPGEILVRGPLVFPGYLGNDAATAAALQDGWLRTGDVGRLDDEGFLYIVDRKKDMILSGGENIASPEIERVIYGLDEVLEVAVVGMPDPTWGEAPAAFVVAARDRSVTAEMVTAHCEAHLGRFKVPRTVRLVGELPRTPSGKVLKRELRGQLLEAGS